MYRLSIVFLFYLSILNLNAQIFPETNWINVLGNNNAQITIDVSITDSCGNIYTAGKYWETINFNPNGTDDFETNDFYTNGYIQKTHSCGDVIWTKYFRSVFDLYIRDLKLTNDKLFAAGIFAGDAGINPDEPDSLFNGGSFDTFFATKLDIDGNFIDKIYYESPYGIPKIEVDSEENLYVVNYYPSSP